MASRSRSPGGRRTAFKSASNQGRGRVVCMGYSEENRRCGSERGTKGCAGAQRIDSSSTRDGQRATSGAIEELGHGRAILASRHSEANGRTVAARVAGGHVACVFLWEPP